jgi:hypothetical protein
MGLEVGGWGLGVDREYDKRPVKRSAGVTASAVVAILGSLASLLFAVLMAFGGIMTRSAPAATGFSDQPVPPVPPGVMLAIIALLYCGFGVWGLVSAAGLLCLKNWARLCFVVFGGLLAFLSLSFAAGSLMAAFTTPLPANVPGGFVAAISLIFTAISLVCLAIAIWWLVYFNRRAVKAEFAGEGAASRPRQFPLAVSIIAWILIAGSVMAVVQMLFSYPLLVFGIVFRGLAASLLVALFAAVGLAAGIGMLKKRAEAYSLAIGYFGFGILNAASSIVLPGSFARMLEVIRETQGSQALPLPVNAMYSFMVVGVLIGVVATSAMLWLLISSRKPFLEACRIHAE